MNGSSRRIAIMILTAALAMSATGCSAGQTQEPSAHDEFMEEVNRVTTAAEKVLGEDGFKKQAMTEVYPITYEDAEGNTILYRICKTTYYAADPAVVTGLNIEAINGVIDPEDAESSRECDVGGKAAAIYEKNRRSYLCWTDTPEYSFILEYTPGVVTEEDIFRMAESVQPAEEK